MNEKNNGEAVVSMAKFIEAIAVIAALALIYWIFTSVSNNKMLDIVTDIRIMRIMQFEQKNKSE